MTSMVARAIWSLGFALALVSPAAAADACARPITDGDKPAIADCLYIARASIGSRPCSECVCDVNGSGSIEISDALRCLRVAIGGQGELACPPCDSTTTTLETCAPCADALIGLAHPEDLCDVDRIEYDETIACLHSCCSFVCPAVVGGSCTPCTGPLLLTCLRETCRAEIESCSER
ncbi:MAG TPA: hypothetical protein VN634_01930 [Candidatus Limnocylindrales bacterium]|nr:hypothetical protein [Candidatus Limnocylindrales bacterium]